MAVMAVETKPEPDLIACQCGQIVARRWHNHIEPLGAPLTLDSKGRPVIVCPVCERFTEVRRSVKGDT